MNEKNERASKKEQETTEGGRGGGVRHVQRRKCREGIIIVGRLEEKGTVQAKEGQKENNLHRKKRKKKRTTLHFFIFIFL